MPVPVPRVVKSAAHPVIKPIRGIPPIDSSPSWKKSKPFRIWEEDYYLSERRVGQDFTQGLAVAGNAMAIKGVRAQACLPPMVSADSAHVPSGGESKQEEIQSWDDEEDDFPMVCGAGDVMDFEDDAEDTSPNLDFTDLATYEDQTYHRSTYKQIYQDHSPSTDSGPDTSSSPLEPVTPFADFVDRAVAAEQHSAVAEEGITAQAANGNYDLFNKRGKVSAESRPAPVFPTLAEPVKEPAPDLVTPSPTIGYKHLSQPLSEWLANYVWKVCTTGLSLSPVFTYPSGRAVHYSPIPPSYLAPSIHSLLLSTLLQPSAIFLAVWYIIRLPGYFNAAELGAEYPKEARFRHALLGDPYSYEREGLQHNAPFRLVVLGCMLANKWLDDHTFSNKTWHSISNIPIQELNRLEALALDVFGYDLSISNKEWAHWMSHLKSYHMSLAPSHLQPIGRPSSNPHLIIRKSIDEIVQAPCPASFAPLPQPVFLGLEERKKEMQYGSSVDVADINLDEDGPLREEYLPRRRTGGLAAGRDARSSMSIDPEIVQGNNVTSAKALPPPAKWSPAGDEPILRDRNRSSGHYVAVQPTQTHAYPMGYRPHDVAYNPPWDAFSFKAYPPYAYGQHAMPVNPPSYNVYPQQTAGAMTHSRSQSLFYDSDNLSTRHLRSYSQAGLPVNDARMTSQEHLATFETDPRWVDVNQYMYPAVGYMPAIAVAPSSGWLRA